MTGNTWLDVAIVAFIVAIFAWWVVDKWRTVTRARDIVRMTLDQAEAEAAMEAAKPAPAASAPTERDSGPAKTAGPWGGPSKPR